MQRQTSCCTILTLQKYKTIVELQNKKNADVCPERFRFRLRLRFRFRTKYGTIPSQLWQHRNARR